MLAFREFENMDPAFWAFVKYISENLGYSKRGSGFVKSYSYKKVSKLCKQNNINASDELI